MENTIKFLDQQTHDAHYHQLITAISILTVIKDREHEIFKPEIEECLPYLINLRKAINLSRLSEETIEPLNKKQNG